jgi:hypothetical protein
MGLIAEFTLMQITIGAPMPHKSSVGCVNSLVA